MPEVTVIVATHNNEETLPKAILSAQNQTIGDIEIIVVDDASTDGTYDLLCSLAAADPRIKCLHLQQNIGAGGARNVALAKAQGKWIAILDGDDWYDLNRLAVLLTAAYAYKADIVADNLKIYDHSRQYIVFRTYFNKIKNQVRMLTAKAFFDDDNQKFGIGLIQPLIRREFLVTNAIVYNDSYPVGEDFLFVAEILLRGARAFIIPEAFYNFMCPQSPTTLTVSPHSHSVLFSPLNFINFIICGCDELLHKYGTTMTSDTRHALQHRRWFFEQSAILSRLRDSLRQRQFAKAARILMSQPVVLTLVGHKFVKLLAIYTQAIRYALYERRRKDRG